LEEEEQGHTRPTAVISDTFAEIHMTYETCWMQLNVCSSFLVVLPPYSATAERSLSTLRRLKNYLRLTKPITQDLIMSLYIMSTRQESMP